MARQVRVGDQVNLVLAEGYTTQAAIVAITDQNTVDLEYHHYNKSTLITAVTAAARATELPAVGVKAQGTLTMDTIPTDGDTYTIDGKTYTFEAILTDVDGNVAIGGTLAQAKLNLVAAMDLSGLAGTDYATSMTAHTTVDVATFIVDDAILTAKSPGPGGSAIATTETFFAGTNVFDATTLGTTTLGVENWFVFA
jgi:hypothetical protein